MAFFNIKINKSVVDAIIDGRTTPNSLRKKLKSLGDEVADLARGYTLTAPDPRNNRRNGLPGPGRFETGELYNSFTAVESGGLKAEVRVGSSDPKFKYHEFGTKGDRPIEAGNMLKDAATGNITGRGSRFSSLSSTRFYK